MQGWIRLERKIKDNWLWDDKPFSMGQAFIDLTLLANHKDAKFPLGEEVIIVERGSFITSELKLMARWGWSKSKVRRFLSLLENDEMIVKKSDHKKTTISIVNYSTYQDFETTEEPKKNHKKTINRPLKDTNNNDNNVNNDNNNNSSRFTPPTLEEVETYCRERDNQVDANNFINFYKAKDWMIGKNKMKDWKAAIITWESRDKKSQNTTKAKSNIKFNQFPQREYSKDDYSTMEEKLLNKR